MDREAWHATVHGVAKSWTRLSDWNKLNWTEGSFISVFHLNFPTRVPNGFVYFLIFLVYKALTWFKKSKWCRKYPQKIVNSSPNHHWCYVFHPFPSSHPLWIMNFIVFSGFPFLCFFLSFFPFFKFCTNEKIHVEFLNNFFLLLEITNYRFCFVLCFSHLAPHPWKCFIQFAELFLTLLYSTLLCCIVRGTSDQNFPP